MWITEAGLTDKQEADRGSFEDYLLLAVSSTGLLA
jgi:hypothetical protein